MNSKETPRISFGIATEVTTLEGVRVNRPDDALERSQLMCRHDPHCPPCDASDREAARVLVSHPEQGWSLLCNGVVSFEDTGDLLPDGQVILPHRAMAPTQRRPESTSGATSAA